MKGSRTYVLAALLAAAPVTHAGMLSTPALSGSNAYPTFECVISNVEHSTSAVVRVDLFLDDGSIHNTADLTVAPGETKQLAATLMSAGSMRCTFSINGPAKDMKDFRGAIRTHDQYNNSGPALPAS